MYVKQQIIKTYIGINQFARMPQRTNPLTSRVFETRQVSQNIKKSLTIPLSDKKVKPIAMTVLSQMFAVASSKMRVMIAIFNCPTMNRNHNIIDEPRIGFILLGRIVTSASKTGQNLKPPCKSMFELFKK